MSVFKMPSFMFRNWLSFLYIIPLKAIIGVQPLQMSMLIYLFPQIFQGSLAKNIEIFLGKELCNYLSFLIVKSYFCFLSLLDFLAL